MKVNLLDSSLLDKYGYEENRNLVIKYLMWFYLLYNWIFKSKKF